MSKVFSDILWADDGTPVGITMRQDVRDVLELCRQRRESGVRSHSDGLGQIECTLPHAIEKEAEARGVDLLNPKERRDYVKWLKDRYGWDFSTVAVDTGNSGKIIIK